MTLHQKKLPGAVLVANTLLWAAATPRIAFISHDQVFIVKGGDLGAQQLTHNEEPKTELKWLPNGEQISYLTNDQNGGKARLVVVDLNGKHIADIVIRPVTDPPTSGLRGIEGLFWISDRRVAVFGSINPENCEIIEIDLTTGKEVGGDTGRCGGFAYSPDGKHLAKKAMAEMFALEEDRTDGLLIDGEKVAYGGERNSDIYITAGPVWSQDSRSVAIIEKVKGSGEIACTAVSISGRITRIPFRGLASDTPSLRWVGSRIVIGDGPDSILIDPNSKRVGSVTSDVADPIKSLEQQKHVLQARTERLKEQLKATEVAFQP